MMTTQDTYFYITHPHSTSQPPCLLQWTPELTLQVEENVDFRQYLELSIAKLGQKYTAKPSNDKFTKVKPVIREIFLEHYSLALKYIHESVIEEGEFYLYSHSKDWHEVLYFSENEKVRTSLQIDLRDAVASLWLTVRSGPGHNGRPTARKHGTPIRSEEFKMFLNLTIQYLYDPNSLLVYLGDYLKNFKRLCQGETKIEGFIISAEKMLESVLTQLEARKEHLSKRLMENDADSSSERIRLRGELEGLDYAIKVVRTS